MHPKGNTSLGKVLTRCRRECGVWKRLVPHNRRGKVIENQDCGSEDIGEMNKLIRSDRRTMKSLVQKTQAPPRAVGLYQRVYDRFNDPGLSSKSSFLLEILLKSNKVKSLNFSLNIKARRQQFADSVHPGLPFCASCQAMSHCPNLARRHPYF